MILFDPTGNKSLKTYAKTYAKLYSWSNLKKTAADVGNTMWNDFKDAAGAVWYVANEAALAYPPAAGGEYIIVKGVGYAWNGVKWIKTAVTRGKIVETAVKGIGKIVPTKNGLAQIRSHLTYNVDGMSYEPNKVMLTKIEDKLKNGEKLTGAYKDFYEHELTEMQLMNEGYSYAQAHDMALEIFGVQPQALYAPEVIQQLPQWFNKADFKYWNIQR